MNTDFRFNYYDILEIPTNATQHEITVAYENAKKTFSSTNNIFNEEEVKTLQSMLEEAYSVLSNNNYRSLYEKRLTVKSTVENDLKLEVLKKDSEKIVTENKIKDLLQEVDQSQSIKTLSEIKSEEKLSLKSHPALPKITKAPEFELIPEMEEKIMNCDNWTGEFLKEVRIYKKISFELMQEMTKIIPWYISSVEKMEPHNLPAKVYVRGYVVQIAKALGLNEKSVADSYMKLFNQKLEQSKSK